MIEITSERAHATSADLLSGEYDLIVAGAGWDARCLVITSVEGYYARNSLLIQYVNPGTSGASKAHRDALHKYFRRMAGAFETIEVDSLQLVETWSKIRSQLVRVYQAKGDSLRVAIDLATLPRYVSMGLVAYLTKTGMGSEFTFWYSAGEYQEPEVLGSATGHSVRFVGGSSRPQPIPALSRPSSGGRPMKLVVSAGFDGDQTRGLVQDIEPSSISVVFTSGIDKAYDKRARRENSQLIRDYLISKENQYSAGFLNLSDVVDTLLEIATPDSSDTPFQQEYSFLLCGTKPHALAFTVAACIADIKNVYLGIPTQRREVTVTEISSFYSFSLKPLWVT